MHGARSVEFCIGMKAAAAAAAMNHFISGKGKALVHNECIWDSVLGCKTMANLTKLPTTGYIPIVLRLLLHSVLLNIIIRVGTVGHPPLLSIS